MKKVLVPFERGHYPQELLDFIEVLHPMAPVLLKAAFVLVSDYSNLLGAGVAADEREAGLQEDHNRLLARFCDERGIRLTVCAQRHDLALPCLERETRYADLLLMSEVHFFEELGKVQPNAWMRELLHRTECPVLLLPDQTKLPSDLILAYDGSADSAFAIRQFAYLFPEFMGVQAKLVYVNRDQGGEVPEEASIQEWCMMHYKRLKVLNLKMRPAEFYGTWIGMMDNPWLIAGSYGRAAISEALTRSFSDRLIREHSLPVFVAHR